jgi:hypothetical protein
MNEKLKTHQWMIHYVWNKKLNENLNTYAPMNGALRHLNKWMKSWIRTNEWFIMT